MKTKLTRSLALLLAVLCIAAALPVMAFAYPDIDFYNEYDPACTEDVIAVQIASSESRYNCNVCVNRLRAAGYNAYLYAGKNTTYYRVMVGAFATQEEADACAEIIRNGPSVRKINLKKCVTYPFAITPEGAETYSEWKFDAKGEEAPAPTPLNTQLPVDLFMGTDGTEERYVIQIAASGSQESCEKCVERLRAIGYNGYLYRPDTKSTYRIVMGTFATKEEASQILPSVRSAPAVQGVTISGSYVTTATLTEEAVSQYSFPFFG